MENTELHTEKVKILSRLVKDNALTLEEALLLLKEEEQSSVTVGSGSGYGTITTNYPPFGTWSTGTNTSTTYVAPPAFISTSASTIINTADESADLNN
jgi:hypothetical protein